ncbi:GTPase HflX [Streptococcus cuniculipharyngis]|uniref:GTPase HflX n=1 Tax=Streptococcus cuniculipharyngis TaxID=1562651 RepID=A0A5C5SDI1_9STRE|nr:GTPase HflX [Streptococcus cuniculipharyngis]TWS98023.1 GTPase HflX [Streptococcus cuniculipharyngis]
MIETKKTEEVVILVGVELPQQDNFAMSMMELHSLAKTAGARVVDSYTQKRERYDSKTFIGSGKLADLRDRIEADEINTVIVNNRLTPRQNSNLEEALGIKVIDRMQLILDIFAMRARSHEGKLQVHLAQLKYMLPRLAGQGIMLSRQAGGIGSRGPGESQLELNRRSIRHQIYDIEQKLKAVEKNRGTVREKRLDSQFFKIGLIGYTNAGKSTLMNLLTDNSQYEADELFATLDATTKTIPLSGAFQATLTDTVGFIQDLPTELVAAFKSTLEESRHVDLLLHVIDASDPNHSEQEAVVLDLLKDLAMDQIPRLAIYNKMDQTDQLVATAFPNVRLSAKSSGSRQLLQRLIIDEIRHLFLPFSFKMAVQDQHKLYDLGKYVIFDKTPIEGEEFEVSGYIAEDNQWRLEKFYDKHA